MSLDNIILTDSSSASITYQLVGGVGKDGRVTRKDLTRDLEEPRSLVIAHSQQKAGGIVIDRHLARKDIVVLDADGVTPYQGSIYLVCLAPRRIVTPAIIWDEYVQLKSLFPTVDEITAWLSGSFSVT